MGCHTWTYATQEDYEKEKEDWSKDYRLHHEFLFRVFDYQENILTSYEQAEKFVLETLANSTNASPKIEPRASNVSLTYSAMMEGKILLASENADGNYEELLDPTITLKRLKSFFVQYPNGLIRFG